MSVSIPYRLNLDGLVFDEFICFCVSVLFAIVINAEGQSFMATLLGDMRSGIKTRHHFNPFLYLDIWGTICFIVASFGWTRKIDIDDTKFSSPRLYRILIRFGGAGANFLLACIAGSIIWVTSKYGLEDKVFPMLLSVNLTTAVYHLLPVPPLAFSSLVSELLPFKDTISYKIYHQAGPFVLIGIFLIERFTSWHFFTNLLDPFVVYLSVFLTQ